MQTTLITSQADEHKKRSCEINTDIAELSNQSTQEDKEGSVRHRRPQRS